MVFLAIDLFAGIGGIRLGFQQAFEDDIKFVFASENNKFSCQTYKKNFHEDPFSDITKIHHSQIPNFDLLLAGFPCQSFSIAGKRSGFDDIRGTLFFNIANILKYKKPSVFLLENVKNLIKHNKGKTFETIIDILELDLNYYVYYKILNSKDYGVPQNRERIFIVGFKNNIEFNFPQPNTTISQLKEILIENPPKKQHISQKYLLWLKKHKEHHQSLGHGFGFELLNKEGISNALVCGGMGHERNLIKDRVLSNCWKSESDSLKLPNNEGIRKLTVREWARLQGFPETYQFPVSDTQAYKQLGNTVSVPVINHIANEIKTSLSIMKAKHPYNQLDFEIWNFLHTIIIKKKIKTNQMIKIEDLNKIREFKGISTESFNKIIQILIEKTLIKVNSKGIKISDKFYNGMDPVEFKNEFERQYFNLKGNITFERKKIINKKDTRIRPTRSSQNKNISLQNEFQFNRKKNTLDTFF